MHRHTGESSLKHRLISTILSAIGGLPIRIVLWDGTSVSPPGADPLATITFRDFPILLKAAFDPELYFGDGYAQGRIEVDGDLAGLLTEAYRGIAKRRSLSTKRRLVALYLRWRQKNTLQGSRRNIHRHYDIGTEFYRLWLDSQLLYTCAYFCSDTESLDAAQVAKMDHVCRKAGLRPGDRVVEAGCGWGALALHMARNYGVSVKAFNISHEQIVYARRRAEAEGLAGQVEFIEDDYRSISGTYDVFMSVGMLEHVGPDRYRELGAVIDRCLEPDGRGFLHFIGRNRETPLNPWIRKRIFPGAEPPTLRQVMDMFELWDFSVLDVENLRLHYARTLEHWLERFEKSSCRVESMYNREFVRTWRLYLAGSIAAFRAGSMQLFQVAFTRGTNNGIPLTRAHLYEAGQHEERDPECTVATS